MTELDGPDLSSIKPVDDVEAARYLGTGTHRWLLENVVAEDAGIAARGEQARSRRPRWRQRGAHHGDNGRRAPRGLLLATLLVATVAAVIVLLPGLLSTAGSVTEPSAAQAQILRRVTAAIARKPETILIQVSSLQVTTSHPGGPTRTTLGPIGSLTIDQVSRNGEVRRSFTTSSDLRPRFEQVSASNLLEIYDPADHTIYETSPAAWQAALQRRFKQSFPQGAGGAIFTFSDTSQDSTGPGRLSVFAQRVRQHLYRVGARTTVDGRPALTLVPLQRSIKIGGAGGHGSAREFLGTVYVSPTTYYPIKEVTRIPSAGSPLGTEPGSVTTSTNSWSEYRVLPNTKRNARLLSLRARHPHARIVRGAGAYLRVDTEASHRVLP